MPPLPRSSFPPFVLIILNNPFISFDSQEKVVETNRATRVEEWKAFMEHMCEASSQVDKEHEAEVDRVRQYYTDIEDRLKINKT